MELKDVVEQEGNKNIATFMGLKNLSEDLGGWFEIPNYHSSWNELMPVVEKILELGAYYKLRNSWGSRSDRELVYIIEITMYDIDGHEVIYEKQSHDYEQINSVYSAVIQFIQWFNSTTLTPLKQ